MAPMLRHRVPPHIGRSPDPIPPIRDREPLRGYFFGFFGPFAFFVLMPPAKTR
jgi:hypothetical protein